MGEQVAVPAVGARRGARAWSAARANVYAGGAAALSVGVAVAAYFDAWTYVNNPSGYSSLSPWQDAALVVSWLALTAWLGAPVARAPLIGRHWASAVPPGYELALAGCLAFGAISLLDVYLQLLAGREKSVENLLSPTRIGQLVSGVLMLSGPLRAAWQRGDVSLGPAGVTSAAVLLSALTFFTQFAHPYRDPWAGAATVRGVVPDWVLQDYGVTSILFQALVLAAVTLLLLRRFRVLPGTFTVMLVVNAALVASLKLHWEFVLAGFLTGLVSDLLVWRVRPSTANVAGFRLVATAVPGVFALSYFAVLELTQGTWWGGYVWTGTVLSAAAFGWLLSHLVVAPARRVSAAALPAESRGPWPVHHVEITAEEVHAAFEHLGQPGPLAESPLGALPFLTPGKAGDELREVFIDIVREMAAARAPRDAEAGKILLEYYVKRSGTHEQVMERLHMSRQTYYLRLRRAWPAVAGRLDELREYQLAHAPGGEPPA
jgi:hypothetical protein